jgi:hypothetical protein
MNSFAGDNAARKTPESVSRIGRWLADQQLGKPKEAEPSSDRVEKYQNALVYQMIEFCCKGAVMVCLRRERKVADVAND